MHRVTQEVFHRVLHSSLWFTAARLDLFGFTEPERAETRGNLWRAARLS